MRLLPALLLAALIPAATAAENKDAEAKVEQVTEGVYAIIHDDATDAWPHGNTGVIVGDDGVLVIDSTYLPSRARADIALIKKITDKPVKYLVMTHWHFDHNNGNSAYRDAFPGIAIVSERQTRDYIDINNTWWPRMSNAEGSTRRTSLADKEAALASGKSKEGVALTDEEKKEHAKHIPRRKAELEELAKLEVVAPNLVFDGAMTLWLGKRRVDLRDMGRANSPHDTIIWLPNERVLFAGDIVVQAPLPYLGSSWPVPWIDVLRELEGMPISAMVPGHGPVMRDHSYTKRVRELLQAVTSKTEAMVREGKTLEQIQAGLDVSDHRKAFAPWEEAGADTWKAILNVLIERAWRGVRGQG